MWCAPFMAPGADQAIDLELHQPLEGGGGDGAQKIAVGTGLDLVEQKEGIKQTVAR